MNSKTTTMVILFGALAVLVLIGVFHSFSEEKSSQDIVDREEEAETRIIAFGDSLTAGYGLPLSESYPAQLETLLRERGYSVRVINAGVSGETTRGNLERAVFIRNQNPDIVLLGIGGNDALRYLPLDETEKNMRATIETLTRGEDPPTVVLLRMQAPLNAGPDYKQSFDALYNTLSTDYDIPLVEFYTEEVFLDPAYKLEDGIHFNKAGYGFIVETYLFAPLTQAISGRVVD